MQAIYLNPLTDFGFKKLFGEEPNKDLLISFLNTLLPAHHQISELTYTKNEYQGISAADWKVIFDLNCMSPCELQESVFQRLFAIAQVAQLPVEERQVYERSLKDYRDFMSAQDTAHLEGYQEGIEEGLEKGKQLGIEEGKQLGLEEGKQMGFEEGKRETARRLLAKGMSVELVAELVGLSLEAIQALV
jgi:hypothetical protein